MAIISPGSKAPGKGDADRVARARSSESVVFENLAENLAFELRAADLIINKMLNTLNLAQKHKLGRELGDLGVSPDGMTRAHERHEELSRYDAVQKRLRQI